MTLHLTEQEWRKTRAGLDALADEFGDILEPDWINEIGRREIQRLINEARFADFVPTLAYRYTRDRILDTAQAWPPGRRAHGPRVRRADAGRPR